MSSIAERGVDARNHSQQPSPLYLGAVRLPPLSKSIIHRLLARSSHQPPLIMPSLSLVPSSAIVPSLSISSTFPSIMPSTTRILPQNQQNQPTLILVGSTINESILNSDELIGVLEQKSKCPWGRLKKLVSSAGTITGLTATQENLDLQKAIHACEFDPFRSTPVDILHMLKVSSLASLASLASLYF